MTPVDASLQLVFENSRIQSRTHTHTHLHMPAYTLHHIHFYGLPLSHFGAAISHLRFGHVYDRRTSA